MVVAYDGGRLIVLGFDDAVLLGGKPARRDPEHSWKHCLIMDEVDGMAGNEDRGGIQVQQVLIHLTTINCCSVC